MKSNKYVYSYECNDKISIEGSIYMVSSTDLKNAYDKLFSTNDYQAIDFTINNLEYKYSTKTDAYIAINNKEQSSDDILFEIDNVIANTIITN